VHIEHAQPRASEGCGREFLKPVVAVAAVGSKRFGTIPACLLNTAAAASPEIDSLFPRGRLEGPGSVPALSGDGSGRLVKPGNAADVEANRGGEGGTSISGISSMLSKAAFADSRWIASSEIEPHVFSSRARRSAA
jgi:hypothetical protein